MVHGFKIISFKHPNIVEIQFYDQYFNTTTDALGATWAGRSILIRHGYYIRLLQTGFRQVDNPFCVDKTQTGYLIGGICHSITTSGPELEDCWEGGMLLAEDHGGWRRFGEHIPTQFMRKWFMLRVLMQRVGRRISE